MRCTRPLRAYEGKRKANGKLSIVWNRRESTRGKEVNLPCGQCCDCRLERSRQWAMRCLHEASLYDKNCFVTLTYDEVNVPEDGCVSVRDFQLFMKKLRKAYSGDRIRFFHCGEYGERFDRPHYHACLFNFDFEDKYHWSTRDEIKLYRSPSLEKIWGKGNCLIGDVTFDSAAYVARYVMKKVNGELADEHYVDKDSGFIRTPEYITMSRRPGIGTEWFRRYKKDVYPYDEVVVNGVSVKPPKFYDSILEKEFPMLHGSIKRERVLEGKRLSRDNDVFRLAVKEKITNDRIKLLVRKMEDKNGY